MRHPRREEPQRDEWRSREATGPEGGLRRYDRTPGGVQPTPGRQPNAGRDRAGQVERGEAGRGPPEFDDETQERIYSHVARNEGVSLDAARDALDLGLEAFTYHLEVLRQAGHVEKRDGGLFLPAGAVPVPGAPGVVVRPARQSDLPGVVAAMREVSDERTYVVAESVAEQVAYEESVEQHTYASSRRFFVAAVEDREAAEPPWTGEPDDRAGETDAAAGERDLGDDVVGWAHLTLPEVEKLAHTAELTVGVVGPYRRMGVGSALLGRALDWATAHGRHRVYQSLPATNRAGVEFLRAHGWRVEAVRENHYRLDGEYVDEVMLAIVT